ncbi:unnamed protein product [Oikopleura dioica]|uniref:BAR domain-containing protein n=1 Tax=Oikopleura dioica TaxID=34765 RepID=E4X932_OIKDI|nr:unnamed protein product [Oikopleura dioica]CBY34447.1 unnamed protein product [Oikopleura dioica]CBY35859.1 unnamed protein product [Oikopleura dioica]
MSRAANLLPEEHLKTLKRLRAQNRQITSNSELEIENCRALNKIMSNIVSICALNKNEAKIQNMKSAFEAITTATKEYNGILRECVIEPNTMIDHLYKKIENTMARCEYHEQVYNEKKIKHDRLVAKAGNNRQKQIKLHQSNQDLQDARDMYMRLRKCLDEDIPVLLNLLPQGLALTSDIIDSARHEHHSSVERITKSASRFALDGTDIGLTPTGLVDSEATNAILSKIKSLKIVQNQVQ